ncbi:MAG: bifunctional phosphopantothenoylcysteine decarboxylase/phosphopantothenate--cysteine ligase CoaBC [Erysipelotrichaceae bacterium]|nr:bifunctional phosphopantothenoylcysteine decarboxylase/phosphopantothenate--cysteine ligase CoaBC [Erysipelotrichaceae bacterium]
MSKKIIIGITGSIAAFKTIQFISDLTKEDYEIEVILTEAGSRFVTPVSIQALTKKRVYIDVFDDDPGTITHVDLVKDADAFLVMPASATTIAKLAHGIADNMLTAAYLAATCPKVIAPAMNVHMFENPVTQRNLKQLVDDGALIVDPDVGLLACGDVGKGKLAKASDVKMILEYAMSEHPLKGYKVVVSAGPTQEAIDPVRFISNHSSGKMGYAIAKAAFTLGADVTLVSGQVALSPLPFIKNVSITSAQDLYEAMIEEAQDADFIIMSAAVADYTPATTATEKIKKNDSDLTLSLKKTKDILYELGQKKPKGQIICGFAMETTDLISNATKKLTKKNADLIIANSLRTAGAGFKTDTNIVTIIDQDGIRPLEIMSKDELGFVILAECLKKREAQS